MPEIQPVRTWARGNIDVSAGGEIIVNSVQLDEGDSVLLPNQDDPATMGVWEVSEGPWTRREDFDSEAEMIYGTEVLSIEGGTFPNSKWRFVTPVVNQVDVSPLQFSMVDPGYARRPGSQLEEIDGDLELTETGVDPGTYSGIDINAFGRVEGAVQPDIEVTYMEGLRVRYHGNRAFDVYPGSAFVPGLNRVVEIEETVEFRSVTLTSGLWYYLYLTEEEGEGALVLDTEPPDQPYMGDARTMGGDVPDDTYRLVFQFFASGTNVLRRFQMLPGGFVRWRENQQVALRVVAGLQNTNFGPVNIENFCPPNAHAVEVAGILRNNDNSSTLFISAAGDGLVTNGGAETAGQLCIGPTRTGSGDSQQFSAPIALPEIPGNDPDRTLLYRQSALGATRSHHIDILGYYASRA